MKNKTCIDFKEKEEYCIAKPSVIKINNVYHMWYTFKEYMIGYASSKNGIDWERKDEIVRIKLKKGWDSKSNTLLSLMKKIYTCFTAEINMVRKVLDLNLRFNMKKILFLGAE